MKYRFCVVGILQNKQDEYLICKKPKGEGVFPGQWGLPGGGIDEGEKMEEAFQREIMEEVGVSVTNVEAVYFRDDVQPKYKNGKVTDEIYMVYLMFSGLVEGEVKIDNIEFEDYKWVEPSKLATYDLNEATILTFERMGIIK